MKLNEGGKKKTRIKKLEEPGNKEESHKNTFCLVLLRTFGVRVGDKKKPQNTVVSQDGTTLNRTYLTA